jgi:hypothetical protein
MTPPEGRDQFVKRDGWVPPKFDHFADETPAARLLRDATAGSELAGVLATGASGSAD